MNTSAGIIITDGKNILLGHSTNNSWWDIPKGLVEKCEQVLSTAIRETNEEFGLDFNNHQLIDLGIHRYTKRKNLHLFKAVVDEMPDPTKCVCSSYFNLYGKDFLEIDDFEVFPIKDGLTKMNKSLMRIVRNLL